MFTAGIVFNAVYGVLQLVAAQGGRNLDSAVLSPLTGGASSINIYGAVGGQSVYRPNALTGDPNHLGIMLIVPLLVLLPVYLRLERGTGCAPSSRVVLAFLFVVELATLSRSGLLGLAVGLADPRRPVPPPADLAGALVPLAASLALVGIVVLSRLHFFETVIRSRVPDRRPLDLGALRRLRLHPAGALLAIRCSASGSTRSRCTTSR